MAGAAGELGHACAMLEFRSSPRPPGPWGGIGRLLPGPSCPVHSRARRGRQSSVMGELGKKNEWTAPRETAQVSLPLPEGCVLFGRPLPLCAQQWDVWCWGPGPQNQMGSSEPCTGPSELVWNVRRGLGEAGWQRGTGCAGDATRAWRPNLALLHLEGAGSGRSLGSHPFREEGGTGFLTVGPEPGADS